ncbi:hypothetical protein CWB66_13210 [Pseudoalteromonas sp. S558]|nr:hypothetical protein CWB66_13210 [Pseudoalteromonas sp. S558]
MFGIYAALSPIYGEQPHHIGAALPKNQTYSCKINHKRSTRPSQVFLKRCSNNTYSEDHSIECLNSIRPKFK